VDVAHVKTRGAGGGDRNNVIPLCRLHHARQHRIGIRSFAIEHGLDLPAFAVRITNDYDATKEQA
jgi:hypothetical protein